MWVALLMGAALGCDEQAAPAAAAAEPLTDVCPELVAKVKEQCGEDSPAYKKHKQLYVDQAPTGEPTSDADAQMRVRRMQACKAGLAVANERVDYSVVPDFSVGNGDAELQQQAADAKKHWETRKAAYEKMSAEDKAKDEAAQVQQRCMLWVLG